MEQVFNNGKFNRDNLLEKETFRYGGVLHNFEKTIGEWADDFSVFEQENHFLKCACCKQEFNREEFPYTGFFKIANDCSKLMIICKECAYNISDTVIEADGTKHYTNKS